MAEDIGEDQGQDAGEDQGGAQAAPSGTTMTTTPYGAAGAGEDSGEDQGQDQAGGGQPGQTAAPGALTALHAYTAGCPSFDPLAQGRATASAEAVIYLYVPVACVNVPDGSTYDPSGAPLTVSICVGVGDGDPTWTAAQWVSSTVNSITTLYAVVLIGPGQAIAPGAGTFDVGVQVQDSPQTFVAWPGSITLE